MYPWVFVGYFDFFFSVVISVLDIGVVNKELHIEI